MIAAMRGLRRTLRAQAVAQLLQIKDNQMEIKKPIMKPKVQRKPNARRITAWQRPAQGLPDGEA
jgi:hypothetical protein